MRTNHQAIILSVALYCFLTDEKLASLRDQRPNEMAAQTARDEAIAHYESLKRDLETIRNLTVEFGNGKAKEKTVEGTANGFAGPRSLAGWRRRPHPSRRPLPT